MPPRVKVLRTEEMLGILREAGHYILPDYSIFQKACTETTSGGYTTVDFIRLYRTFSIDNLQIELGKTNHRLSTPDEGLALAMLKHQGDIGDISDAIIIPTGIKPPHILCLQMWSNEIRITKTVLNQALRAGNFVLTTSLKN